MTSQKIADGRLEATLAPVVIGRVFRIIPSVFGIVAKVPGFVDIMYGDLLAHLEGREGFEFVGKMAAGMHRVDMKEMA